jgi:arabinogalactan endo-1,4-beta-galactosidase
LEESGVRFYDRNGQVADLFQVLADGGVNYARIRIWNDPWDAEGRGYGGGNTDVARAAIMAKRATDAGMKVLLNFHYSDFWADPGKQMVPKAWQGFSVEQKATAIYEFTKASVRSIRAAGGNVAMVQIGNETNGSICGVSSSGTGGQANFTSLIKAGARAVREVDPGILVAVHISDPQRSGAYAAFTKMLDDYDVDYDVFGSSYYPFWHGTIANLTSQLATIANTYNKRVAVFETSYMFTTNNGDGWSNTGSATAPWTPARIQTQADFIHDIVAGIAGIGAKGAGVFLWEPAWIPVGTTAAANRPLWEQYGSGWATSYAAEYDPNDAGQWFGGGDCEHRALFDYSGNPLPTADIFNLLRTGSTQVTIVGAASPTVTVPVGDFAVPNVVAVELSNGSTRLLPAVWTAAQVTAARNAGVGTYTIAGYAGRYNGAVVTGGTPDALGVGRAVTLTLTVVPAPVGPLQDLYDQNAQRFAAAPSGYTASTWGAFAAAMENAESVLAQTRPSTAAIDDAVGTLAAAAAALEPRAQAEELAILESAVNLFAQYESNASYYTAASFARMALALADARALLANPAEVSATDLADALAAFNTAAAGLVEAVDTTVLNALIDGANAILAEPSSYVSTHLPGLAAAAQAAATLLSGGGELTDAAVATATDSLLSAIQRVHPKGDPAAAIALVDFVGTLVEAQYTPTSWTRVETAASVAAALAASGDASLYELEDAATELTDAIGGLTVRAVKGGLIEAISIAMAMTEVLDHFVPSTVAGLASALDRANAVREDLNATDGQVAAARTDLLTLLAGARLRPPTAAQAGTIRTAPLVALAVLPIETPVGSADGAEGAGSGLAGAALGGAALGGAALGGDRGGASGDAVDVPATPSGDVPATPSGAPMAVAPVAAPKVALAASKPVVKGVKAVGKRLRAAVKLSQAGTELTYRWYRGGKPIAKAVKATYTLTKADLGKKIRVKVTVSKPGSDPVARVSAPTGPIR